MIRKAALLLYIAISALPAAAAGPGRPLLVVVAEVPEIHGLEQNAVYFYKNEVRYTTNSNRVTKLGGNGLGLFKSAYNSELELRRDAMTALLKQLKQTKTKVHGLETGEHELRIKVGDYVLGKGATGRESAIELFNDLKLIGKWKHLDGVKFKNGKASRVGAPGPAPKVTCTPDGANRLCEIRSWGWILVPAK